MRRLIAALGDPVVLFLAAGCCAAVLAAFSTPAAAATLTVGPGGDYALPSEAAQAAKDGDTVEIMAGDYVGDVARWKQNDLTIRAVGGRAHIKADGKIYGNKALWVIAGNDVRVIGMEFSGAKSKHGNGAGIRSAGRNLSIIGCYFHDNQMGLMTGHNEDSTVTIDSSEFAWAGKGNTNKSWVTHNVYIGRVKSFVMRFSSSHHAVRGHNVKSRAQENIIAYNEIADMSDGRSSYLIDLPDAGRSVIVGNILQQGPDAENWALVSYGQEKKRNSDHHLAVVNNTLVNLRDNGVFIVNRSDQPAQVVNNIFWGPGTLNKGPVEMAANLTAQEASVGEVMRSAIDDPLALVSAPGELFSAPDPGFRNPQALDFHLTPGSPAIDAGVAPPTVAGLDTRPIYEYVHPLLGVPRVEQGAIDIGAYEYVPEQASR